MTINDKIIVKNYKCFDASGGGFDRILPINVIIGKNNSGKTSLIELTQYLTRPFSGFVNAGRENLSAEVTVVHKLTKAEVSIGLDENPHNKGRQMQYLKFFIGREYTFNIGLNGNKEKVQYDFKFENAFMGHFTKVFSEIPLPLLNKNFCGITAERDIVSESATNKSNFSQNGSGATSTIQSIINNIDKDRDIIENDLLKELNSIINPDIRFTRILVQNDTNGKWEVFFENFENKRIALSKMGSGIKTVLLVLLNLIVRPKMEKRNPNSYIFCFEELENNLHPSLQRRLYNYIKQYSQQYNAYFFITTHSNIVIDSFGMDENAQLIHVENDGIKSMTSTILSFSDTKQVLYDLGIKASDILQSNSVIWVEGPSDRNYLNKWLEILAPDLIEGLHYSIMFYGGRLLSNVGFDFDWFDKDVIPLLKINKNSYVIIDRDGKGISAKLNATKKRICDEIGEGHYWITKGREIENYLSDKVVSEWLLGSHNINANFQNEQYTKLEDNISQTDKKIKLKYNLKKPLYSSEIAAYIDEESLNTMDLSERLNQLIEKIRGWNK